MKLSYKNNQYPIITMKKDDHVVKLYSMIHVAPESFYDDVYKGVSQDISNGFVVHMEGIKDSPFKKHSMYQEIADTLGFAMQSVLFSKFEFKKLDYTYDQLPFSDKVRINIARKILDLFIDELKENERLQNSIKDHYYDDFPKKERKTILDKIIQGKTITTARSLHAAQQALLDDSNVSLLWGRGHSEEIVNFLLNHGYKVEKEKMITIS